MNLRTLAIAIAAALATATGSRAALAAGDQVVIGDIDDMSGVYADVLGAGGSWKASPPGNFLTRWPYCASTLASDSYRITRRRP